MIPTQLVLALDDRHAGQAANLAAGTKPHQDDTARVEAALTALIHTRKPFTASDVHRIVEADGLGPYNRNLVSSRIGTLAAQHVIYQDRTLNPQPAHQRARKGSRNPWWRPASNMTRNNVTKENRKQKANAQ